MEVEVLFEYCFKNEGSLNLDIVFINFVDTSPFVLVPFELLLGVLIRIWLVDISSPFVYKDILVLYYCFFMATFSISNLSCKI